MLVKKYCHIIWLYDGAAVNMYQGYDCEALNID